MQAMIKPSMVTALLSLAVSPAFAQLRIVAPEKVGVSSERLERVKEYLDQLVARNRVAGGVVMVSRRGRVILHEASGKMDREAHKPMQKDAIFRIASMTKPVVALATMMLIEDGRLNLDDRLSKHLPEFRDQKVFDPATHEANATKREITIRDLLRHTSGLTFAGDFELGQLYEEAGITSGSLVDKKSVGQMMRRLAQLPLFFEPGDRWHYGMSSGVLGGVIEVASGVPLDQFLRQRVFVPLGMDDTHFIVPGSKTERVVRAYALNETTLKRLEDGHVHVEGPIKIQPDTAYNPNHRYRSGGGGLSSTAEDYMRFCMMLLEEGSFRCTRLIDRKYVRQMSVNQLGSLTKRFEQEKDPAWAKQFVGFGFGFFVVREDFEFKSLSDSYQFFGAYSTSFAIIPRSEMAIVVMLQTVWNEDSMTWAETFKRLAAAAVESDPDGGLKEGWICVGRLLQFVKKGPCERLTAFGDCGRDA